MSAENEDAIEGDQNDQLVLICGESGAGKSASFRNIKNQERWVYFNTEAGKRLPFKNKFEQERITDPKDIPDFIEELIEASDDFDGFIIDSTNFMMDMFESVHVINSSNGQKAWGDYNQFFKDLMQDKIVRWGKPVLMTGHVFPTLDEGLGDYRWQVPVKGALSKAGIEAFFSTIVYAKKVKIKTLEKYKSDLLTITEEDRELGFKHVFQTRVTKDAPYERIRAPMGMFSREQTFIDPDAQLLLDHLKEFYS